MSTETETKPKVGVRYTIDDRGVIIRHDERDPRAQPEKIAALSEGVVRFSHPDFVRFSTQVKTLLKSRQITATIEEYVERPPVERVATMTAGFPVNHPAPVEVDDPNGIDGMRTLSVEQRKAINYLRSREGFPIGELERPAPPKPAFDSGSGDKTPAYVRWLLRYHPAKFAETYGLIGMGSVEVTVPGVMDPETNMLKPATRKWESGHVLARRATVLTECAPNRDPKRDEEGADS